MEIGDIDLEGDKAGILTPVRLGLPLTDASFGVPSFRIRSDSSIMQGRDRSLLITSWYETL